MGGLRLKGGCCDKPFATESENALASGLVRSRITGVGVKGPAIVGNLLAT